MLNAILDNHLGLASIILLLLLMVPALLLRGYKLRNPARPDRRKKLRSGVDRRA